MADNNNYVGMYGIVYYPNFTGTLEGDLGKVVGQKHLSRDGTLNVDLVYDYMGQKKVINLNFEPHEEIHFIEESRLEEEAQKMWDTIGLQNTDTPQSIKRLRQHYQILKERGQK